MALKILPALLLISVFVALVVECQCGGSPESSSESEENAHSVTSKADGQDKLIQTRSGGRNKSSAAASSDGGRGRRRKSRRRSSEEESRSEKKKMRSGRHGRRNNRRDESSQLKEIRQRLAELAAAVLYLRVEVTKIKDNAAGKPEKETKPGDGAAAALTATTVRSLIGNASDLKNK